MRYLLILLLTISALAQDRLLITDADLARMRDKVTNNATEWQALKAKCEAKMDYAVIYMEPGANGNTTYDAVPTSGDLTVFGGPALYSAYQGEDISTDITSMAMCYIVTKDHSSYNQTNTAKFLQRAKDYIDILDRNLPYAGKALPFTALTVSNGIGTITTSSTTTKAKGYVWIEGTSSAELNDKPWIALTKTPTTLTFWAENIPNGTYTPSQIYIGNFVSTFEMKRRIGGVTKGNPTTITHSASNVAVGDSVVLSGFTGGWAVLNGTHTPTFVSTSSYTIPVDTSGVAGSFSVQRDVMGGVLRAAGTKLEVQGNDATNATNQFTSGSTVWMTGWEGCTALNGTFTVTTPTTSTFYVLSGGSPVKINAPCTNYAWLAARNTGYNTRSFGPAIAAVYSWLKPYLTADDKTRLIRAANYLYREAWYRTNDAGYVGPNGEVGLQHPAQNFFAGHWLGAAFLNVAFGSDNADSWIRTQESLMLNGPGMFVEYFNRWYPYGFSPQGGRWYGINSTRNLLLASIAKYKAGVNLTAAPYNMTWQNNILNYFFGFVSPTLSEMDGIDWTTHPGSAAVPREPNRMTINATLLAEYWARITSHPDAARATDFYRRTRDAAYTAATTGGVLPLWNDSVNGDGVPQPWYEMLFRDDTAAATDFRTAQPLTQTTGYGSTVSTRTGYAGATDVQLIFDPQIDTEGAGNGKKQYAVGGVTLRRGRNHLIGQAMYMAAAHGTAAAVGYIASDGSARFAPLNNVFWAERPLSEYHGSQVVMQAASLAVSNGVATAVLTSPLPNVPYISNVWVTGTSYEAFNDTPWARLSLSTDRLTVTFSATGVPNGSYTPTSVIFSWSWLDMRGAQSLYNQCNPTITYAITESRPWYNMPAAAIAGLTRNEDQGSYAAFRGERLHCAYGNITADRSLVDGVIHTLGWNRDVVFLRPSGVAVVYDRTLTAKVDDDRFMAWPTPPTPVEYAIGSGMKQYRVTNAVTGFHGALTVVHPQNAQTSTSFQVGKVTYANWRNENSVYPIHVRPPVGFSGTTFRTYTVLDAVSSTGDLTAITPITTSSNVEAAEIGTASVVGFATTVPATLPITYTVSGTGTKQHIISGLDVSTVYKVAQSGADITISAAGGGQDVTSTAAGVLSFSASSSGVALSVVTASLPNGTVGTAYSQSLVATGGTAPYTWDVTVGTLPGGLTLSSGGILSGTPTTQESQTFTVRATDAAAATATKEITLTIQPAATADLTLVTASLPNAVPGIAYSYTLAATGGVEPYTWDTTSGTLPDGLTLSSAGVISGTPTTPGTATVTYRVTDAQSDTATKSLGLTVVTSPTITTTSLPAGTVGVAYSQTLAATGGTAPYTWTLASGTLPDGLNLSSGGVISGTPTTAGESSFTVEAEDATTQTDTQALTLSIGGGTLAVTANPPGAKLNVPYSTSVLVAGGVEPYSYAWTGSPCYGLTASGPAVSGTPNATGTCSFTLVVTDALSATANVSFDVVITASVLGPISVAVQPTADGALVTYGVAALAVTDICTLTTLDASEAILGSVQDTGGAPKRTYSLTGLTAATAYYVGVACGSSEIAPVAFTTLASSVATAGVVVTIKPPNSLAEVVGKLKVEYGPAFGDSVTDAVADAGGRYSVTIPAQTVGSIVQYRWQWLTSGDVAVTGTSKTRYAVVK